MSSDNSTVFGQTVTFTAMVEPVGAVIGATGTVDFFDHGLLVGSGTLSLAGVATLPIASLSAGSHSITAEYLGDASHAVSTSAAVAQTVTATNTQTSLGSSSEPATVGATVTFTATVTAIAPGGGIPVGTVQFKIDGATAGLPQTLDGTGKASISTATLAIGPHTIDATFTPTDGDTNGSVAVSITQDIDAVPTLLSTVLNGDSPYVSNTMTTNQHSMVESVVYSFSSSIDLSDFAGAVSLAPINGTTLTPTAVLTPLDPGKTRWSVTFTGDGVDSTTHSIGDGEYRLTLNVGGLMNTYDFFRLLGDMDGNGTVDSADFSITSSRRSSGRHRIRHTWERTTSTATAAVDSADFSIFVSNYLHTVPPPT